MSTASDEPTRPFTDPDQELARRQQPDPVLSASPTSRELSTTRNTTRKSEVAERQGTQQTRELARDAKDCGKLAATWPDATQWYYMKLAFSHASESLLPEARIILSHAPSPQGFNPPDLSTAVKLPYTIEGRSMVGVVQRTHDVDFTFSIPFSKQPAGSSRPSQSGLKCRILYHPANDSCLLFNMGSGKVGVGNIETRRREVVSPGYFAVLHPGYWRVSVGVEDSIKDLAEHLADLLLVQRRYHVSFQDLQKKRPKAVKDETEVIIEPRKVTLEQLKSLEKPIIGPSVAILDLKDGQTALLQSTVSVKDQYRARQGDVGLDPYELTRIDGIAYNPSTTVFTCSHSGIDAPGVVAKVLRYKDSDDGRKLAFFANSWIRETQLLQKLNHRNIVSLCGMDGRQFAIYLELLPRSLARGPKCNLSRAENLVILRDISSALAYIAEKGIYHNDIKPGNIAFSRTRGGVLLDFGFATEGKQAPAGGTPWYLPREYYDYGESGATNDVWALGVTLLYTLGMIPFPDTRDNFWTLYNARLKHHPEYATMVAWMENIEEIRTTKLDRDDVVQSIVYDMLEKDTMQRVTAATIHKRLDKVAS